MHGLSPPFLFSPAPSTGLITLEDAGSFAEHLPPLATAHRLHDGAFGLPLDDGGFL
ncbi:MAG: hypothetical protein ACP5IE_05125 [Infirmifilum sp.]